jgi:ABC-type iron transport system FetAB permease component
MNLWDKLNGKKTLIGSLILSLLGAVWSLDVLIDGTANWLTEQQYVAIGTTIAGMTGAAMRLAVGKVTSKSE